MTLHSIKTVLQQSLGQTMVFSLSGGFVPCHVLRLVEDARENGSAGISPSTVPAGALTSVQTCLGLGIVATSLFQGVFLYADFLLRITGIHILRSSLNGLILAHQKYFYIHKPQGGSWFPFFQKAFLLPKTYTCKCELSKKSTTQLHSPAFSILIKIVQRWVMRMSESGI